MLMLFREPQKATQRGQGLSFALYRNHDNGVRLGMHQLNMYILLG